MKQRTIFLSLCVACGAGLIAFLFLHHKASSSVAEGPQREGGTGPKVSKVTVARPEVSSGSEVETSRALSAWQGARKQVPARKPRGAYVRVVLDENGSPMEDVELDCTFEGSPQNDRGASTEVTFGWFAKLRTASGGLLDLSDTLAQHPGVQAVDVLFWLHANTELELRPRQVSIADLGRGADDALELRALPRLTAPVRGQAFDAATGKPLVECVLCVEGWFDLMDSKVSLVDAKATGSFRFQSLAYNGPAAEWFVTDSQGRFETQRVYPSGRILFSTMDETLCYGEHRVTSMDSAEETRLRLAVAPRILLDFDPPAGLRPGDFIAGLWRAPVELMHEEGLEEFPSLFSPDHGSRAGLWGNAMPVQGFSPPWVRLSLEQVEEMPLPSRLFVASRDGRVFGQAAIDEFERYLWQPLRIELEQRQALEGVIVWPENDLLDGSANLTLQARGASPLGPEDAEVVYAGERWVIRMHEEAESPFVFQFVPAGKYSLEVRARGGQAQVLDVELPRPDPLEVAILPAPKVLGVDVEVRVRTTSGEPLDGGDHRAHLRRLLFTDLQGNRVAATDLEWREGVGRFVLGNLPRGSYRFFADWAAGGFVIPQRNQTIELPTSNAQGGLDLLIDDQIPTQLLEVRVIDPQAEGEMELRVEGIGGLFLSESRPFCADGNLDQGVSLLADGRRAARFLLSPFASSAEPVVTVRIKGYKQATLLGEDFGEPDEGGIRHAEIIPEPGWSADVRVLEGVHDQGVRLLEGIVLAFDGRATTPSDAAGLIHAEADQPPKHLEVLTAGWDLVDRASWDEWGSVIAAGGRFTVEQGRLTVYLKAH